MVVARLRRAQSVPEAPVGVGVRPMNLSLAALDLDEVYCSRFDANALAGGEFLLINSRHKADLGTWQVPEASHLWNFNLHYFAYCVPIAARVMQRPPNCSSSSSVPGLARVNILAATRGTPTQYRCVSLIG